MNSLFWLGLCKKCTYTLRLHILIPLPITCFLIVKVHTISLPLLLENPSIFRVGVHSVYTIAFQDFTCEIVLNVML